MLLEIKRGQQEASRQDDKDYVVYGARANCSYGLRTSVVIVEEGNGVYIAGAPQLTVDDTRQYFNIVPFGACFSPQNSTKHKAADEVLAMAKSMWSPPKAMGAIIDFFTDKEDQTTSYLLQLESPGICMQGPVYVKGEPWTNGKDNVFINGKKPLLRCGECTCFYGGIITLETSGQLEK